MAARARRRLVEQAQEPPKQQRAKREECRNGANHPSADAKRHVSSVCFLFTVSDGKITGGRLYRNDAGLAIG
jgi:ketosteroid isomerase-like protein